MTKLWSSRFRTAYEATTGCRLTCFCSVNSRVD